MGRRLVALALCLPMALALAQQVDPGQDLPARIQGARDAYRAGEGMRLAQFAEAFRGHELAPWVEYWQLRLRLDNKNDDGVEQFLDRERGSYLAEKLRAEWLRFLGKNQNWQRFEPEFRLLVQPEQEQMCYALQMRMVRQDKSAQEEARTLVLSGAELTEPCQAVFESVHAQGRLSADDLWERVRRLLENKRLGAAKQALRLLPAVQRPDFRSLDAVADNPARYLARLPAGFAETRPGREMVLFAIQRMARNDPAVAATLWQRFEPRFDSMDRAYIWGQLAWQAALRHRPEAIEWFRSAPAARLNDEQRAWKARAALRALDWPLLGQTIGEMPVAMAGQPEWIYWLGRSLAARGKPEEAARCYERLAGQANFYGNLADEELGRKIAVPVRAIPPNAGELADVAARPGLRRALALLGTELRIEGVREWVWTLRGMNDRQLLAAAELARRNGVFDRAINTADRTVAEHDFHLRFLAPFRERVEARTRQLGLDTDWVYGLMRQESRFVMDARSSAGARGLMQLMPATARWVAKKIGLNDYQPGAVTEMETNVLLGTHYLKMVLDALDNQPVLASAAYNAGPGRARRWRGERPLEGAIYAETIPFTETRDYVKKVMSNTVYYAALYENKPQSLKGRLGVIRPGGGAAEPDLP